MKASIKKVRVKTPTFCTILDFMRRSLVLVNTKLKNTTMPTFHHIVDYFFVKIDHLLHIGFDAGVDYPN